MSSEELIRESRRHPKIDDRGMMDVPFLVLVLLLGKLISDAVL